MASVQIQPCVLEPESDNETKRENLPEIRVRRFRTVHFYMMYYSDSPKFNSVMQPDMDNLL